MSSDLKIYAWPVCVSFEIPAVGDNYINFQSIQDISSFRVSKKDDLPFSKNQLNETVITSLKNPSLHLLFTNTQKDEVAEIEFCFLSGDKK